MTHDSRLGAADLLTGERCERLRELFDRALDQPAEIRADWIAANVADADDRSALRMLLAAEAGAGPLDMPSTERILRLGAEPEFPADGLVGQRIGAFRLVRLLGQGGMAAVFLGERDGAAFRQQVAVKLLRRGLYSAIEQRLFRREQQALAALSHPNIAHLIDGGVTDAGIPYLILEFVDGLPITQHAVERGLDLRARLRLFVVVCRAVAAAHRQLIVHRDLKPSNILVDGDGQVKLLDFGIAKLLDEEEDGATRTGFGALTPGYAAPEQYDGGAITTATDVFALGVVLQELLLGGRVTGNDTEARRPSSLLHGDTTGPWPLPMPRTSLVAALKGDLDNIVLKALAAEPERRYASAGELAEDIERHLEARPVSAHPPSGWYRTRKFVQRHRGGVALSAAFVIGVLASLGIALWQANVARTEAANARAEAQRANTTRDFIEQLFQPVRQQIAEGRMPSLRELVGAGADQLDATEDLEPAQRIDLLLMFSRLQHYLAETEQSLALAEKADALADKKQPPDSALRVEASLALGRARVRNSDYTGAEPILREVERHHIAAGTQGPIMIDLFALLARLETELNRPQESLRYTRREFDARLAYFARDAPGMASGHNNLGYALEGVGRFDEAIDAYKKALDIDSRSRDPGSIVRTFPLGNLAQAEFNAGRLRDALSHFAQSLAIHADVGLSKPTRTLLGQLAMLAATELALGELERAKHTIARLQALSRLAPPTDIDHASALRLTAMLAFEQGRPDGLREKFLAIDALVDPLDEFPRQRVLGRRDVHLAELALLENRPGEAAELARRGIDGMGEAIYPRNVRPYAQALLAQACATSHSTVCARDTYTIAADAMAQPYHHDHPALLGAQVALARVELERQDFDSAITRLRASATFAVERGVVASSPRLAQVNAWLAVALAHAGDCDKAAHALTQAAAADAAWPRHPLLAEARVAYRTAGQCLPTDEVSINRGFDNR